MHYELPVHIHRPGSLCLRHLGEKNGLVHEFYKLKPSRVIAFELLKRQNKNFCLKNRKSSEIPTHLFGKFEKIGAE